MASVSAPTSWTRILFILSSLLVSQSQGIDERRILNREGREGR